MFEHTTPGDSTASTISLPGIRPPYRKFNPGYLALTTSAKFHKHLSKNFANIFRKTSQTSFKNNFKNIFRKIPNPPLGFGWSWKIEFFLPLNHDKIKVNEVQKGISAAEIYEALDEIFAEIGNEVSGERRVLLLETN